MLQSKGISLCVPFYALSVLHILLFLPPPSFLSFFRGGGMWGGGEEGCVDVAHLVERRTSTPLTLVRFPGAARDFFFPESTFIADSPTVSVHPRVQCSCINICLHVKAPVVHVRVRWIMEILKHPVCIVGWVAPLCHSWLSPGKMTRISHGGNPSGTRQLLKDKQTNKTSTTGISGYHLWG